MKIKEIKREIMRVDSTEMIHNPQNLDDAITNISLGIKVLIGLLTLAKVLTGSLADKKIDAWITSLQIIAGTATIINEFK